MDTVGVFSLSRTLRCTLREPVPLAFQLLEAMEGAIAKNAGAVELARTGSDIERITSQGKIAIPLAIE